MDFHGARRSNATHRSVTDPDARLARKGNGQESKLAYQASVVMHNRYGLIVNTDVRSPSGTAECDAALEMLSTLEPRSGRRTKAQARRYRSNRNLIARAYLSPGSSICRLSPT